MSDSDTSAAFTYAFPVYEMAKLRWNALYDRAGPMFTGLNRFWHQERLATHADRWVTTPNVDTLYSSAWIALDQGPVRLDIPATDGRYLSVAMLDMFTDNFAIIGQRDSGFGCASVAIVGPQCAVAPPDNIQIAIGASERRVVLVPDHVRGSAERRALLVDNRLARYCLNDRSPGLEIQADQSIDILLQHDEPPAPQQSNWLPAPKGKFRVTLRAYLPRANLIDNRFRLPPIRRVIS